MGSLHRERDHSERIIVWIGLGDCQGLRFRDLSESNEPGLSTEKISFLEHYPDESKRLLGRGQPISNRCPFRAQLLFQQGKRDGPIEQFRLLDPKDHLWQAWNVQRDRHG